MTMQAPGLCETIFSFMGHSQANVQEQDITSTQPLISPLKENVSSIRSNAEMAKDAQRYPIPEDSSEAADSIHQQKSKDVMQAFVGNMVSPQSLTVETWTHF